MPRVLLAMALLLACSRIAWSQQQPIRASDSTSSERATEEASIRENVAAFVKAYNEHDAKAIANLFAEEGQIITEDGVSVKGRDAIEGGFNEVFAETPETSMEVTITSIRFLGDDLAAEVGTTKETPSPGETPVYGRYTALHVKRAGKWLMLVARDNPGEPPTHHERLLPIAWLLGEWVDEEGSTVVRTNCRWSDNKNYLLQDITYQIGGREAMRVSQRIGWDPVAKRIRSWAFDSQGGFSEGIWVRDGSSWVIKTTGVRSDGHTGSATSIIVPTGPDGYVWRVHDRVIGDTVEPPLEVRVVRKPPVPNVSEN